MRISTYDFFSHLIKALQEAETMISSVPHQTATVVQEKWCIQQHATSVRDLMLSSFPPLIDYRRLRSNDIFFPLVELYRKLRSMLSVVLYQRTAEGRELKGVFIPAIKTCRIRTSVSSILTSEGCRRLMQNGVFSSSKECCRRLRPNGVLSSLSER